jgi:uroporphyrin-III C-methyltransferase/precorrin-2 dehydrogenase/sirohydrochlorin ferrochelatase
MNAVSPPYSTGAETGLAHLPIFLEVRNRPVLLIGGGAGTAAKLDLLRRAGARVRLVDRGGDPLAAAHFEDAAVAVDASGDPAMNRLSRRLARAAGVPLNVVDRPALCDFIFPAILDRAPVIVAVSTGGLAPAIARLIRQRLEIAIPAGIGCLAGLAARFRSAVAVRLRSQRQSISFWDQLFDGEASKLALAGRMDAAAVLAEALLAEIEAEPDAPALCTLHIASDDPEMLTIRAARMLRMAEVIIHDPGIAPAILELGRRDARRIAADVASVPAMFRACDGLTVHLRSV